MLPSHGEEYPGEYENLKFAANSPKMILLAWRNIMLLSHSGEYGGEWAYSILRNSKDEC